MNDESSAMHAPIDAEVSVSLAEFTGRVPRMKTDTLHLLRTEVALGRLPAWVDDQLIRGLECEDIEVLPRGCETPLRLLIVRPADHDQPLPTMYYIHGGGMVSGNRWTNTESILPLVASGVCVLVSVEYRLAPEFPYPHPQDDCYAGLIWTAENILRLGGAPNRLLIGGTSAGGGLAASCALRARDFSGPELMAQVLISPMLDDRMSTVSSRMLDGTGVWDREENRFAWAALAGRSNGAPQLDEYAAPARAKNLARLPRTYLEVGSAETFRDEVIDYASRLLDAGVLVDLHLWGGAIHALETVAPQAELTRNMVGSRSDFIRRVAAGSTTLR